MSRSINLDGARDTEEDECWRESREESRTDGEVMLLLCVLYGGSREPEGSVEGFYF